MLPRGVDDGCEDVGLEIAIRSYEQDCFTKNHAQRLYASLERKFHASSWPHQIDMSAMFLLEENQ